MGDGNKRQNRRHILKLLGAGIAAPAVLRVSPALAAYLKRRLTEELGPEYATLLDLLSEARESMRAQGRSSEDADWQEAFGSGILDLVRAGQIAEAKELLRSCL